MLDKTEDKIEEARNGSDWKTNTKVDRPLIITSCVKWGQKGWQKLCKQLLKLIALEYIKYLTRSFVVLSPPIQMDQL